MSEISMICSSSFVGENISSTTGFNLNNGNRYSDKKYIEKVLLPPDTLTASIDYGNFLVGSDAVVLANRGSNVKGINIQNPLIKVFLELFNNSNVIASWQEFNELDECAKEEDIERSGETAKQNAKEMLSVLCHEFPAYYMVYPEKEKSVAIEATARKGHRVLLVCENDGRVSCFLLRDDINRRAHYSSMKDLPDSFIREALSDLK